MVRKQGNLSRQKTLDCGKKAKLAIVCVVGLIVAVLARLIHVSL